MRRWRADEGRAERETEITDPFKVDGPTIISTSGKVGASVTLEDQWLLNRLLGPLHVAPGPSDFRATVELVPVSRWGAYRIFSEGYCPAVTSIQTAKENA